MMTELTAWLRFNRYDGTVKLRVHGFDSFFHGAQNDEERSHL